MEPADLNRSDEDELRLKHLLRDTTPVLPDNGFSARVVAALPTRRAHARVKSYRSWFITVALLGGLALAWSRSSAEQDPAAAIDSVQSTLSELATAFAPLTDPMLAIGTLIAIACCAFALWSGRQSESTE